jgi:hypothetical protein
MKNKGKKEGGQFIRTVDKTSGDLNSAAIDLEGKYGSRISQRFGLIPFRHGKNEQFVNIYNAL